VSQLKYPQILKIFLISMIIGVIGCLWALGFVWLLEVMFTSVFLPLWQRNILILPLVGIGLSTALSSLLANNLRGHGVAELFLEHSENRTITPFQAIIETLTALITIGLGGSAGKQGPMVLVGSAIGTTVGRFSDDDTKLFAHVGVASVISALFVAPIGAIIFVFEVLKHKRLLVDGWVIAVGSLTSYGVARLLGSTPLAIGSAPTPVLWTFGLVGVLAALCSVLFITLLYGSERFLVRFFPNRALRAVVGGGVVIALGVMNPTALGLGNSTIEELLLFNNAGLWFFISLGVVKLLTTSVTLGSGGSGGIFSPALLIGVAIGGAVGVIAQSPAPVLLVAAMASVVAASVGSPISGALILLEYTQLWESRAPIIIAVLSATLFMRLLTKETIFTKRLTLLGVDSSSYRVH